VVNGLFEKLKDLFRPEIDETDIVELENAGLTIYYE